MSIKRMSAVWEHSKAKGNDRLCLLALADKANDLGFCWPGISDIERQMNATRQTTLNSLDRLEALGELYAERRQRIGGRYLVLSGLTDEQIIAGLMAHFSMAEESAQTALAAIHEKRDKSRNHTSKRDENLDRINTGKKSRNHTKKVYGLDQKSLAARPDPSLNVNKHHIGAANADASRMAAVADPPSASLPQPVEPTTKPITTPTPVEPTTKPEPPARAMVRDEVIAECKFAETARNDREVYGRAGKITRYLLGEAVKQGRDTYHLARADWAAQPGDFARFSRWWRGKFPRTDVPRSLEVLHERWAEWREAEARTAQAIVTGAVPSALDAERALYGEEAA